MTFFRECIERGMIEKTVTKKEVDALTRWHKNRFHERVFTLWKKRKKQDKVRVAFNRFIDHLETILAEACKGECDGEQLRYLLTLEPTSIHIFDFRLVTAQAKECFYRGIKLFHKGNFTEALDAFMNSTKMNPENPWAYWNIGRIKYRLKHKLSEVVTYYNRAKHLLQKQEPKKRLIAKYVPRKKVKPPKFPRNQLPISHE